MRKLIVLFLSIVFSCLILTSCNNPPDTSEIYKRNISDLSTDVYEGKSDNFTVFVYVGEREKQPTLDGVCGEKQSYFTVRVLPKTTTTAQNIEYKLSCGGKAYNGVLPKSINSRGYMYDLAKNIECGKSFDIELSYGDINEKVTMSSVLKENSIGATEALAKITEKYGDKLRELTDGNNFNGEIILRLISDNKQAERKYYWYVAIIDKEKSILSTLIDSVSGEFVA